MVIVNDVGQASNDHLSHRSSEGRASPEPMNSPQTLRSEPANTYAWYVVAILMVVYAMNMADRQIVAILAEEIKAELELSDTSIGIMTGPAIALFYALLGVPMARLADRTHRVRLLAVCLVIWSGMTALGGLAANFMQLLATRLGVSVAEAGATPTSVSLIADYFPPEGRGKPLACFTAGATLGVMLGLLLGGAINEALGWRWAFLLAGLPGIALGLIMLATVREPIRRGDGQSTQQPRMVAVFRVLWAKSAYRRITYATCLSAFGVYGMLAWVPVYAVRNFGLGTAQVGQAIGIAAAVGGGPMMILSGVLIDRLARHGMRTPVKMASAMMIGSAAFFSAALAQDEFVYFVICFAAAYGMLVCYMPLSWTVVLAESPPEVRSQATAILLLCIAIFPSVMAPLAIGALSDVLQPAAGAQALAHALLLIPLMLIFASMAFMFTAGSLPSEIDAKSN